MASFKVIILPTAEDEYRAVAFPFRRELGHAMMSLQRNPRPETAKDLGENHMSLTVHGWEVLYVVSDIATTVVVYSVAKSPPASR